MTDRPERRTISLGDEARPSPFFARECATPSSESMLPGSTPLPPAAAGAPRPEEPPAIDLPDIEFEDRPPPPPPRRTRRMPVRPGRDPTLPPLRLRDRVRLPSLPAVALVLLLAGGAYVHRNWNRALVPTPEHRALVVTADRLATFLDEEVWVAGMGDGFAVDPAAESIEVRRRLGGTLNVVYRYAGRGVDQPTLAVEAGVYPSITAARAAYRAHEIEAVLDRSDLGEGIVERVELDRDCRWGDDSSAALVLREAAPRGNEFLARSGRAVLRVELDGVALQDGWGLRQLLAPTLNALAAHE